MSKRTPNLDWVVAKSEAEWERLRDAALTDGIPSSRQRRQSILGGATVLCLLLTLIDGWEWHSTPPVLSQSPVGSKVMPQPTASVGMPDRAALLATILGAGVTTDGHLPFNEEERRSHGLPASKTTMYGNLAISRMALQGDRAAVSLIFSDESGVYRQTHFYEHTAAGWLRIAPVAELWRTEQSLATPYFVYHFRQNDAQVVTAVAPQVDALYTSLRTNFGLPALPAAEKLMIDVSVTHLPGAALVRMDTTSQFSVPSPALYLAPVTLNDEQLLAQSLALPLLDDVIAQAVVKNHIRSIWQPLRNGLRLWQLWDLDLPLATWQDEVVTWIYLAVPTTSTAQSVVLPTDYAKLCAMHQLWLPTPWQLGIPVGCAGFDQEELYQVWWSQRQPPIRLAQLGLPVPPNDDREIAHGTDRVSYPGQTVALATLVEYAVATYGRERLPVLLAGLGQCDSWETLIPGVYGVSPAEFEAGWQGYLAERYGVSPDTFRQ